MIQVFWLRGQIVLLLRLHILLTYNEMYYSNQLDSVQNMEGGVQPKGQIIQFCWIMWIENTLFYH